MDIIGGFGIGILAALAGIALWSIIRKKSAKKPSRQNFFISGIEQIRAIGELSAFKVYTKEIVTEVDHSWGEFGKKYLTWIMSTKKMAMIFEFEIDFRYDLRSPSFRVEEKNGAFTFIMPPCFHEIHIRDIHFYDEQKSRLVPWLLPDFINNIFTDGFTEEDKNRIKNEAKKRAEEQAKGIIEKLSSDVERSASQTLQSLAKALGATNVNFTFNETGRDAVRSVEFTRP
ncbi:MAG TPA: DUF4230 domain-containing protein [Spirochaetota bacterium]|nr:DUF4230 domain-containing protein [Spirochaetota bacterium]HPI91341.1 DUF4230 domain-containing protein [Spirochaetota bacterium]HPR50058.1 DUF4230 domain-containing protein [Spirochaetota bacterium]